MTNRELRIYEVEREKFHKHEYVDHEVKIGNNVIPQKSVTEWKAFRKTWGVFQTNINIYLETTAYEQYVFPVNTYIIETFKYI